MGNDISEIPLTNPLKAWASNGLLRVTGLSEGKVLRVYSISGVLVYQSIAAGNEETITLTAPGVYRNFGKQESKGGVSLIQKI